jgi:hypothetical protein
MPPSFTGLLFTAARRRWDRTPCDLSSKQTQAVVVTNCDDKSCGLGNTAKMPESQGRVITEVSRATAGGRVRPIQGYYRNPPGTLAQLNIMRSGA